MKVRTVKDLAAAINVVPRTVRRNLTKQVGQGVFSWDNDGEKILANTVIPGEVWDHFVGGAHPTKFVGGAHPPPVDPVVKKEKKPKPYLPGQRVTKKKKAKVEDEVFGSRAAWMFSGLALIIADGIACSWIAWNSYEGLYQYVAGLFFLFIGLAMGYISIASVVKYRGEYVDLMIIALFAYQSLLHLSALQCIGESSFYIGKVVVGIGLPVCGSAFAIANK